MGDGLKLYRDKRHRSSSSIAGATVDGTRSERKLNIRVSIPEADDPLAMVDARCEELHERINTVKKMKTKKKLKKRSTTGFVEAQREYKNMPIMSVQTQPKKNIPGRYARTSSQDATEVTCGDIETSTQHSDIDLYDERNKTFSIRIKKAKETRRSKLADKRRTQIHKHSPREENPVVELYNYSRASPTTERRRTPASENHFAAEPQINSMQESQTGQHGSVTEIKMENRVHRTSRSHRYEMPTVASQMKRNTVHYYCNNKSRTNIPFVVTKSTAPSHNVGVNIQQVLHSLKIQQPLTRIPLTMAHLMGLGNIPPCGSKSASMHQTPDTQEMNAISLGNQLIRLPSHKLTSYNRLLALYSEGEGVVPRFLRAVNEPLCFYTSMYNLATTRDDFDRATSKGRAKSQEAKQSLAEYANLYKEYENVEKRIRLGRNVQQLKQKQQELSRELAAREDHIRKVVQEYRASGDSDQPGRSSASAKEGPHDCMLIN